MYIYRKRKCVEMRILKKDLILMREQMAEKS